MTENPFQPATREAVKARIALTGPAGSGKTYTALALATNLADKVAVVDTERGRAKEYAGIFTFDHFAPERFDPRELIRLLAKAGQHGYGCVVVDSFSHYWMGKGGALEFVDERKGFTGGGWKDYRPIENQLMDGLLSYPGHLICTMRVKTAYEVGRGDDGKQKPVKVGMKPEQRDGVEYEFSVVGEMNADHALTVSKTTCPDLADLVIPRPGAEMAGRILAWIAGGEQLPDAREYRDRALDPATTYDEVRDMYREVKRRNLLGAPVVDDHGDDTNLGQLLERLGLERKPPLEGEVTK